MKNIVFRKGKDINLCPLSEEVLPVLVEIMNCEDTTQYLIVTQPLTLHEEKKWFEKTCDSKTDIVLVITERGDPAIEEKVIGVVGLHKINYVDRTAEIGCAIRPEYCNKGYGTESIRLMIRYALRDLNLRKINSTALASNYRSIAAQKKVGFYEEGIRKKQVFSGGKYVDLVLLSIFHNNLVE